MGVANNYTCYRQLYRLVPVLFTRFNSGDFYWKIFMSLINVLCTCTLLFILGSIYLNDCRIYRLVPIFLIVFGCVSLLQTAIHIFRMFCGRKNDERSERANQGSNCCETLISVFLFVWIIVGSYWVFSLWNSWGNNPLNCNPVLVYFSFITLLVIYGTALLFCCCIICCVFCCAFLAAGGAAAS